MGTAMTDEERERFMEWVSTGTLPPTSTDEMHDLKCWTHLAQKINRIELRVHKPWWRKLFG